ncbi:ankyrin repeat-containing protein BDA1-like isoform X1 [Actinidia eriantha]|uniref:ankyrin repeat-containing protein BDA1-like isoform X1 n=1 Tax=Actinidia eriantha TaxID=165200 RepID=UPI00258A1C07|nr:ankyrin repeat-containing protein BDA1-like isoform X1 [Actinidia eriantha]
MSTQTMEEAQTILSVSAGRGDINGLYNSIKLFPNILDHIDDTPFVDSPMHIAASAGHANFAIEIFTLKSSFGRKLNPDGLSPLHLALQNGHFETVKRVIKFDKELVRVKGRERLTLLHFAAKTGDVDMLAELLYVCPELILDLTVRDETALHIAVKNMKLSTLKVLLGFLSRTSNKWLLKSKDEVGNTVLHTAVATSQPQMVKLLVKNDLADKNEKNLNGDTALDIAIRLQTGDAKIKIENILRGARASQSSLLARHRDHDFNFADFLKSREKIPEKFSKHFFQMNRNMSMEMRNIVLVVAALIATATFQAVLSPPGGVGGRSDNYLLPNSTLINATMSSTNLIPFSNITHINATVLLPSDNPFKLIPIKDNYENGSSYGDNFICFYLPNTIAFLASVTVMIVTLPVQGFLPLHCYLFLLILSYGISFNFISPSYSHAMGFKLLSFIYAGVIYCLIIIKDLYNTLCVSHLQKKRVWMLHWLVMNSRDYSKNVRP